VSLRAPCAVRRGVVVLWCCVNTYYKEPHTTVDSGVCSSNKASAFTNKTQNECGSLSLSSISSITPKSSKRIKDLDPFLS
jgi:hypothetical protein